MTNTKAPEMVDEVLRKYAAFPEAHRAEPVIEGEWGWRDDLAANAHAQHDYDTRQLEARRQGAIARPSSGWTFEDRVLARGWVDAMIAAVRNMSEDQRQAVFDAMNPDDSLSQTER